MNPTLPYSRSVSSRSERSEQTGRSIQTPSGGKKFLCFPILLLVLVVAASNAVACVCEDIAAAYAAAVAQFVAGGGTDAALYSKICRLFRQYEIKCEGRHPPLDPPPPPPPGGSCDNPGGGGGGRGGGAGGGGPPGGGPIPWNAWMRNHSNSTCNVCWTIVPVTGNPAGFTVSPTSGTNPVPGFTSSPGTLAPFAVTIASNVPPGTSSFFDIFFTNLCNGLPFVPATSRFEVRATTNVCVIPLTPLIPISDGSHATLTWRITNCTASPITKHYTFGSVGDPASLEALNNGSSYYINNAFPADKSNSGGDATIPPNSFVDISWEIVPSRYCDPEMLGCCFLEVDGAMSCIVVPGDQTQASHHPGSTFNLYGVAQGGQLIALVTLSNQTYSVQVPTFPGDSIPAILDRLAAAMLSRVAIDNAYNFQPLVDANSIGVMAPDDASVNFMSTDPGLLWSNYSGMVSALSPLGYWRLNETTQPPSALAATNRGAIGTLGYGAYVGGTPGVSGALAGSTNKAARFNGAVVVPYSSALSLSTPFTVEAWLKAGSTTTGTPCPLAAGTFGANRSGWSIYQNPSASGTGWNLKMYNGNGANTAINLNSGPVVVPGAWYHIAAVYNGPSAVLYVNGVGATAPTNSPFVPDLNGPLTLGMRSDTNFPWPGSVDELAIYPSALSQPIILQHYQDGTNTIPPIPYDQLILSANPMIYLRLDEPALPGAVNNGTLGTNSNGAYEPGSMPGVSGVPFSPLGANNYGCQVSGPAAYVDLPGSGLNLTGPVTVIAWCKANPANGIFQTIVGKGDTSYRLDMDWNGYPRFADGLANPDVIGPTRIDDGQWHFLSGVYNGSLSSLYVDGLPAASTNAANPVIGSFFDVCIGSAPDYPTARPFNGVVDEVAIFNNALSAAQIRQLYYAALWPPNITLTIAMVGNQVQLTWGRGLLQSADAATGPYTDVTDATSPYNVLLSAAKKFYRARE